MPRQPRDSSGNTLPNTAAKTSYTESTGRELGRAMTRRGLERAEREAVDDLRAAVVRDRRAIGRRERLARRLAVLA
ncbi:MAG TPA: hypothetical protein VLA98_14490 [Solirubrobacteraceae bacterium]|nr:hypothetical protein [Solirubrobacteraceae bacterium]